ncbi:glycerate kinase [Mangrovivirga sp. M17]|uniref:Glycerate kinase n=1 Tax=Mangrovivirga halotolerans TaxID=2993936 RepID=A0ABT3RSZ1_9BACT|nr:glycerate kinase [Mangrovivirga halotolerans]MCX2744911.1 glycerate kinase [Mangrovivirga halotolerans]
MPEHKNILIAPNAFKGTLSSLEVSDIIHAVFKEQLPGTKFTKLPLADGGDGTLDVLSEKLKFDRITLPTFDPLGRSILATYGLKDRVAYIELAEASGISHLKVKELDPKKANTFGTGILVKDAIDKGASTIKIFCGGSASIDLGLGIIAALLGMEKYRLSNPLFDADGILKQIDNIRSDYLKVEYEIYTDVINPLLGDEGAVQVFGMQKGVEEGMRKDYEEKITAVISQLNIEHQTKGMGASGGIPVIFDHLKNVKPELAGDYILKILEVEDQIEKSDLTITGEGKFDQQSISGKLSGEILKLCQKHNTEMIIISALNGGFYPDGVEIVTLENYLSTDEKKALDYTSQLKKALEKYIKKHDW